MQAKPHLDYKTAILLTQKYWAYHEPVIVPTVEYSNINKFIKISLIILMLGSRSLNHESGSLKYFTMLVIEAGW